MAKAFIFHQFLLNNILYCIVCSYHHYVTSSLSGIVCPLLLQNAAIYHSVQQLYDEILLTNSFHTNVK